MTVAWKAMLTIYLYRGEKNRSANYTLLLYPSWVDKAAAVVCMTTCQNCWQVWMKADGTVLLQMFIMLLFSPFPSTFSWIINYLFLIDRPRRVTGPSLRDLCHFYDKTEDTLLSLRKARTVATTSTNLSASILTLCWITGLTYFRP